MLLVSVRIKVLNFVILFPLTPLWPIRSIVNRVERRKIYLGAFNDEEMAARRYDKAAESHGRRLNFPPEGTAKALKSSRRNKIQQSASSTSLDSGGS
jgi:hypothetical protein